MEGQVPPSLLALDHWEPPTILITQPEQRPALPGIDARHIVPIVVTHLGGREGTLPAVAYGVGKGIGGVPQPRSRRIKELQTMTMMVTNEVLVVVVVVVGGGGGIDAGWGNDVIG